MIEIIQIKNKPVPSNTYIIYSKTESSCIVVDPGTENCPELFDILDSKKIIPKYIVLTHEHIDHIAGISTLSKHFNQSKIVCSADCNKNINSFKYNLTGYSDRYEENTNFPHADIVLEDIDYKLSWNNLELSFYKAKGHSTGSILFQIENRIFVGDTLIPGHKTTTILPGGSKEELIKTFEMMLLSFDLQNTIVYSGHEGVFTLSELETNIKEQICQLNKIIKKKRYETNPY